MNKTRIFLFVFLLTQSAQTQFSGHSLFEFQGGNVPEGRPANLKTAYEQLNLNYRHAIFQAGIRFEGFVHEKNAGSYQKINQYKLRFRHQQSELKIGHFYEMLGRGLLLRSYEIPGSVYEDDAFRVRYGFYKDLEGVLFKTGVSGFALKAMRARPLVNGLPPIQKLKTRRQDLLYAVQGTFLYRGQEFGGAWLQNHRNSAQTDYGTVFFESALSSVNVYGEYAQQLTDQSFFNAENGVPRAVYGSISWTGHALGLSAEFKDYDHFFLGSGFNEPPSLIREHSWVVLNRSTHVLQPLNEQGYQIEGYWHSPWGPRVTANMSRAVNDLHESFHYHELFVEIDTPWGEKRRVLLFADRAEDLLTGEKERWAAGAGVEQRIGKGWIVSFAMEYQQFDWHSTQLYAVQNQVLHAGLARGSRYHITVIYEQSTDPRMTDKASTLFEVEQGIRRWAGMSAGYRPGNGHQLQLFAGKRRGGPACASGVCYEILDFEGAELRYIMTF